MNAIATPLKSKHNYAVTLIKLPPTLVFDTEDVAVVVVVVPVCK